MSMHEPDGVHDEMRNQLRVALTAGGRLAEMAARQRQQALHDAQGESAQRARELQGRLDSERGAARAALAPLEREGWWERAEPRDVAEAWRTAQTWRDVDPVADRAAQRIRTQLRSRYDLDVDELGADPAAVSAAVQAAEQARDRAAVQRGRGDGEFTEAVLLAGDAGVDERTGHEDHADLDLGDAEELYDSAARRERLAASLEGVADAETVQARVVADSAQGRPAAEAVAQAPRAPRARRSRAQSGRAQERTRGR